MLVCLLLRYANLVILLISDESVGDIPEGQLDGLFVSDQRLSLLRFGGAKVPAESTAVENGLRQLSADAPCSNIRAYEGREYSAPPDCTATAAGDRNLRKESSFGDSDLGIGRDQVLLGLGNVGTPREQRRR